MGNGWFGRAVMPLMCVLRVRFSCESSVYMGSGSDATDVTRGRACEIDRPHGEWLVTLLMSVLCMRL